MNQPFPPPSIHPFERLHVTDGLLMTAERWRQAHAYHRARQNLIFQSLQQPGIVRGLGVHLIPSPTDVPSKYQDGRWVQIQPGLAIDLAGNPIVVPDPIDFRITTTPTGETPLQVYLVLSYVDPDSLNRVSSSDLVREMFRIDEKNSPPEVWEVEVCRILLEPGTTQIQQPRDVFFPQPNALDFRFRMSAQARPQHWVRVAQIMHPSLASPDQTAALNQLAQAAQALYPALQCGPIAQVALDHDTTTPWPYDVLYLSGQAALTLAPSEQDRLAHYLQAGGVLLVDVPPGGAALAKSVMRLAQQLHQPLEYLTHLSPVHPLRCQPFLFGALPQLPEGEIQVLLGGGIVVLLGGLAQAWGIDPRRALPRETIRTAQEFGLNLLHFAGQRHQWTGLIGESAQAPIAPIAFVPGNTPLPEPPLAGSRADPPRDRGDSSRFPFQ